MIAVSWNSSLAVLFLISSVINAEDWDGSIEKLLRSQPERFAEVMKDPAKFRLQILYTQIDRDANNQPHFRSFTYRLDEKEYFYPASTVKLPMAILALEKLNRLKVSGLDRDSVMFTGAAGQMQTIANKDDSSRDGLPRVSQYVKKILLVSDNDAFNRLYEFVGHEKTNRLLDSKGYQGARIVHRLELALGPKANRHTNPIQFLNNGKIVYEQPAEVSQCKLKSDEPILVGKARRVGKQIVDGPKDFAASNCFPLQAMHDVVQNVIFPSQAGVGRFDLHDADYSFLHRYMSAYPRESGIDKYADHEKYPDGHVKFLMFGGERETIPSKIRIFNKVGKAYGFLTDAAYIVDYENKIEFLLAATIYTNSNQIINDDNYEYEKIGLPFLRDLGKTMYELELQRKRQYTPDLSRLDALHERAKGDP